MGYFEARQKRTEDNHRDLHQLAKDVFKKDPNVKAYFNRNDSLHESVVFIRDEEICSIGFHEVPFGWSGCGYPEFPKEKRRYDNDINGRLPFNSDDVLNHFKPIQNIKLTHNTYFDSVDQYLKWYSYLVEEPL
jgi:hypothetical protein